MESRRRYASIILSAFAGSNGLKVLLDQCALIVARARQPDILHMIVGPGQDGKTLVFVDHMRAVFGSGFGCAPSSMLQTEREFQQQGSNFIQCCYLVFDECRREQGLIEDLVKVFVGGGWLPLRRNHEPETKYGHWAFAGKAWCLNVGDIPYLPTSQEISHARRFRCTFMRSHFTSNAADVDPDRKIFKADPSAKIFMASGEAVWCFYNDFLFPHLRKFGIHACSNALEYGTGSASTAKDSEWLLKRMNRSTDACCPEDLESQDTFDHKDKRRTTSEKIVRETHNVVDQEFFSAADVNRLTVPSNPGAVLPKGGKAQAGGKKLRVDFLKESIQLFPNLIRLVAGQTRQGVSLDRFQRRQIDVADWERRTRRKGCRERTWLACWKIACKLSCACEPLDRTLEKVAQESQEASVSDVFGSWDAWPWRPESEQWQDPEEGLQTLPKDQAWSLVCHVDVAKLRRYQDLQIDRRPEQLQAFLSSLPEDASSNAAGVTAVTIVGHQKILDEISVGRVAFPWSSLPHLTREARAAASPEGSREFDMPNAVVFFALQIGRELNVDLPAFARYSAHKALWRKAVMQWLGMSMHDAKKTLLRAVFGFASLSASGGKMSSCPLLDALAVDGNRLKQTLADKHPGFVKALKAAGKKRPETSTMAYILFDRENTYLQDFASLLPKHGFHMVSPVYDAVVAVPGQGHHLNASQAEQDLLDEFDRKCGVRMQVSTVQAVVKDRNIAHIVEQLLANGNGMKLEDVQEKEVLPGIGMCIPQALINLFPTMEEDVRTAFEGSAGPFSYREIMEQCRSVNIEPIHFEDRAGVEEESRYLLHDSEANCLSQCGHCYGVLAGPSGLVLWTSHQNDSVQLSARLFWEHAMQITGVKLFRVECNAAQRKRKRTPPMPIAELELRAGMDLGEDMMAVIRHQMAEEVKAEVSRLQDAAGLAADNDSKCRLCPFRTFQRRSRTLEHVEKYHDAARQVQICIVASIGLVSCGQMDGACGVMRTWQAGDENCDLLSTAADLIASWVSPDADTLACLKKQNSIDLVLLLTGSGPQYVLKAQTAEARRLNKTIYYQKGFADLVLAKALRHRGKIHAMFNDITSEWVARGCQCSWLGCRRRDSRTELVQEVMDLPYVQSLRGRLVDAATSKQEWIVCSHDATYQTLFSIIGQRPMQQRAGEAHALHTVIGRSGAVPGFSLQATEGCACFRRAVAEILPIAARRTVRFLFSDSPESVEGATDVLPALEGVAEDPLHLVLRVEACTGERRTTCSAALLRVQMKFRCPQAGEFYQGERLEDQDAWADVKARDWASIQSPEYLQSPYSCRRQYLEDLRAVCQQFPEDMKRKDHKGRTVLQIIQAGGSGRHFRYLLNGSHILAKLKDILPAADMQLLSFGTCSNEALHAQLKSSQEVIVQQHVEVVPLHLSAFSLGKLLAHHAAAYFPTIAQRRESEILSLLQGRIVAGLLPALSQEDEIVLRTREDLRKPVHELDSSKVQRRQAVAARQQSSWQREQGIRKEKRNRRQVAAAHVAATKRTIFTKKKPAGMM
ncbi:unnamed protein product [Symbiodinium sp. CCMP2456]|nr:unnamed protein product [Symbiodinium sp. CCMP2456]